MKVTESKIDNCIERMQQPLISDKTKEEFKTIILAQAYRFDKSNYYIHFLEIMNPISWCFSQ